MDGWVDEGMDVCMDGLMKEWMVGGWVDEGMDGGWMG